MWLHISRIFNLVLNHRLNFIDALFHHLARYTSRHILDVSFQIMVPPNIRIKFVVHVLSLITIAGGD